MRRIKARRFEEALSQAFQTNHTGEGVALSFDGPVLNIGELIRPYIGKVHTFGSFSIDVPHDLSWAKPDMVSPIEVTFNKPIVIRWGRAKLVTILGFADHPTHIQPVCRFAGMIPIPISLEKDYSPPRPQGIL